MKLVFLLILFSGISAQAADYAVSEIEYQESCIPIREKHDSLLSPKKRVCEWKLGTGRACGISPNSNSSFMVPCEFYDAVFSEMKKGLKK